MKEHPILFSAPLVRAVLRGQKTVTRRIAKIPAEGPNKGALVGVVPSLLRHGADLFDAQYHMDSPRVVRCPYGAPGDRLWGREATYIAPPNFGDTDLTTHTDDKGRRRLVGYVASMDRDSHRCAEDYAVKQTPSIHMPRWASRLSLEVVSVRAERLHDIDDADAEREGVCWWSKDGHLRKYAPADAEGDGPCWPWVDCPRSARAAFERLWCEVGGAASWAANPWVWRVEFKRCSPAGEATSAEASASGPTGTKEGDDA